MLNEPPDSREVLKVLVIGDDEQARAAVRATLAALSEPELSLSESTLADPQGDGRDIIMVVCSLDLEPAIQFIQNRQQADSHVLQFAVLPERSAHLMRRVLRAGADEVLFLPLDGTDAARALLKISETRRRRTRAGNGMVCSVASVKGGVGVTSLVANLGLAMQYALQKKVALVDLDLQSSDLSVLLNVEPERTISDVVDPGEKLDSIQLESTLTKHVSGAYLLAAPKRIQDGERVAALNIGTVLALMRQMFDYVVVDCGRHVNENAVAAWEHSDHLFYVLDQSIESVRSAWRFLELYALLGLSGLEPDFVVSRFLARNLITEEQITNTLARPMYAKIPRDEKLLEAAMNQGQDLWKVGQRTALTKSYEDLARKVSGGQPDAVEQPTGRIFSRLFSLAGANT